jgi:hypothetical protein
MRKIIRLTESDLTRIVRRVLREAKDDETQYHRYQEGGDPGIEPFLENPMNEMIADELQHQLENDKYAKGPDFLRNTNLGKGTGKLFIFFNGQKMTPSQFIDQVQEDASEGYCHTINTYEYNNRVLASTKITITTKTGDCKKSTPVKDETPVKRDTPTKQKQTKKNGCPLDYSEWYINVLDMGGTPFNWTNVVPKMGISRRSICNCFSSNSRTDIKRAHATRSGFCAGMA